MRMAQTRQCLRFTLEPGFQFGILRQALRKDFNRHEAVQPRVASFVHLTLAAKLEQDFIGTDSCA
jgi:hypothetical protein